MRNRNGPENWASQSPDMMHTSDNQTSAGSGDHGGHNSLTGDDAGISANALA